MAAEKTRGNTLAAVEALKKYLEIHAGDKDAWEEMGDLYLEVCMKDCSRPAPEGVRDVAIAILLVMESWQHLTYHPHFPAQLLMYKQAMFCYEELLLFQPANPQYLVTFCSFFSIIVCSTPTVIHEMLLIMCC